mmetsp:Transcript_80603/g.222975  ORF Transcript_80603/g.222975 Transcript_80603/m.222975 type:complete len:110 (+) Transcript_80603:2-331(+)
MLTSDLAVVAAFDELAAPAALMLFLYGALWVLDGILYGLADYAWIAGCTLVGSVLSVTAMLLFGDTAQRIWWCLNILTIVRTVAVLHRCFFSCDSAIARTGADQQVDFA